eukprot:TRINITY_DN19364_c0_g1_i1.p1 TRINITY_DN19364_c0_g1~~TRINITY_DN19364_c0_g1_i1.p1  ORF type:complete len:604 (+),score=107.00 TRINITY_DN19364_c0_g1_i1:35-1813(+)
MDLEAQLLEQLGGGGGGRGSAKKNDRKNDWKKKRKGHQREEEEEKLEAIEVVRPKVRNESVNIDTLGQRASYSCTGIPKLKHGCFMKSSEWSPDGSVLLTNCEDNVIRLFNLPEQNELTTASWGSELQPSLTMSEGECIYDMSWFPKMADQNSCCFVASSRDHPIHLWDANSGTLRATYNASDDVGPVTAYSLKFTKLGSDHLIAGYKSQVRIFNSSEAGETSDVRSTTIKIKKRKSGLAGIISTIDTSPSHRSVFGLGTFSSSLGIFDIRTPGKGIATITNTAHAKGGITGLRFSRCGTYVFTSARKDGQIKVWDLRRLAGQDWDGKHSPLASLSHDTPMTREAPTNQRIGFDFDISGRYLYTGCHSGALKIFDWSVPSLVKTVQVSKCALNGVSTHPSLPLLSLTTGERRFRLSDTCDVDNDFFSVSSASDSSDSEESSSSSSSSSSNHEADSPSAAGTKDVTSVSNFAPPSLPPSEPQPPIDIQLSVCGDSIFGEDQAVASTLEMWSGELITLEPSGETVVEPDITEPMIKRPAIEQGSPQSSDAVAQVTDATEQSVNQSENQPDQPSSPCPEVLPAQAADVDVQMEQN